MVHLWRLVPIVGTLLALLPHGGAARVTNSTDLPPETAMIPNAYTVEFADGYVSFWGLAWLITTLVSSLS